MNCQRILKPRRLTVETTGLFLGLLASLLSVPVVYSQSDEAPRQSSKTDGQVTIDDMKMIGLAYHGALDALKRAPKNTDELAEYFNNDARLLGLLKAGRIIVVDRVLATDISPATVIAYESKADKEGGLVVLGDGSAKRMSADDFKAANLPKQTQRKVLDRLKELNEVSRDAAGDPELATRIEQYERAYRLQSANAERTIDERLDRLESLFAKVIQQISHNDAKLSSGSQQPADAEANSLPEVKFNQIIQDRALWRLPAGHTEVAAEFEEYKRQLQAQTGGDSPLRALSSRIEKLERVVSELRGELKTRTGKTNAPAVQQAGKSQGGKEPSKPETLIKVFQLEHAQATHVMNILNELFHRQRDQLTIADDARTNSVIVQCEPGLVDRVESIIKVLDLPSKTKAPEKAADPKEGAASN